MRTKLFALTMALLLLTGCAAGKAAEESFTSWRGSLTDAARISCTAAVTADLGESVRRYDAKLVWSDGAAEVELLSPETLAGIRLRSADGGVTLEYDGASLELGKLPDTGLSPAAALPAFLQALLTGRVLESRTERDGELSYDVLTLSNDAGEFTVWLAGEPYVPVRAEMTEGGKRRVSCEISDWKVEE
jgi:outer membrane lipoprotein-sorting protein